MHQGSRMDQESILLWNMSMLNVFCLSEDKDAITCREVTAVMKPSYSLVAAGKTKGSGHKLHERFRLTIRKKSFC